MNPAKGGSPIIASAASVKAVIVPGMARPIPSIWLTFLIPKPSARLPAAMNMVIFITP